LSGIVDDLIVAVWIRSSGARKSRHVVHFRCGKNIEDHCMTEMDRVAMLKEFLNTNPKDSFTRYGLAMEYARQGSLETALAEFRTVLANDPDYTAAYQMAGQMLMKAGRMDDARQVLEDGIASAVRTGNSHARAEMEGMLMELG
jgi:predicted Zn-dependent protease